MSTAIATRRATAPPQSHEDVRQVTLLELVTAIAETTSDDREIVATVLHMLRSGSVRLCGNFRGEPLESFED